MHRLIALLVVCLSAFPAAGQDYAREARWKAEVLGNLVVGDAVDLRLPSGRAYLGLYTEGKPDKRAILLVHGSGVHPNHGVIGSLRIALSDMGYTTLSIQMPVLAADAQASDYYPALFPEASQRIAAAAQWLSSKNHQRIVLASHSLGAWMAQYHLQREKQPFAAWISMGRSGAIPRLSLPVLDVYGEKDYAGVLDSARERRASKQVVIAAADHFYTGKEEELARVLRDFIESLR